MVSGTSLSTWATWSRRRHEREDDFPKQDALYVRLREKGGSKRHEMCRQHNLTDWLREYIEAGIGEDGNGPLFRTVDRETITLGSTGNAPGRWSSAGRARPGSTRPASAITPSGAPASRPISRPRGEARARAAHGCEFGPQDRAAL